MSLATSDPQPETWQRLYAGAITDPRELLQMLELPQSLLPAAADAGRSFPLRVPRGFVELMEPGNPRDPLLLQVLPQAEERHPPGPGFVTDPVGDEAAMAAPGVLQKYAGRALFIATGACAINCRYCFRRHFPYDQANAGVASWEPAMAALRQREDITELILSGGDPLVLGNRRLRMLGDLLRTVPHVRRLRIHTRLPVVLPERVDEGLLDCLTGLAQRCVMVLHINHPREIGHGLLRAASRLRERGITLLNQAVLLRGVNDDADTLTSLCEGGFDGGILPYYLHALDPVAGGEHFLVPDRRARRIAEELRRRLPGYLVPTLVREVPGQPCKTPLTTGAHD